eukprot:EG_transcript_3271
MSLVLSVASSAVAGLGGAVLLPVAACCCTARRTKRQRHGNEDVVVGFLVGTVVGVVAGVPLQLEFVADATVSWALQCAAVTGMVWTPVYVTTLSGGPRCVARYAVPTAVSTTAVAAGVAWGCRLYTPASLPTLGVSALVVAASWDLVVLLVVVSRGAVTATLPIAVEAALYTAMGLALYGMAAHRHELCYPFLCACSVLLPYSGWYGLRLSLAVIDSVPAMLDPETQALLVKKPEAAARRPVAGEGPLARPPAPHRTGSGEGAERGAGEAAEPEPEPEVEAEAAEARSAVGSEGSRSAEAAVSHLTNVDTASVVDPAFHLPPPVTSPAVAVLATPPPSEFYCRTFHVFVIPNYNESVALLSETLTVLANHPTAAMRYGVLLAMEGKEAGAEEKVAALRDAFRGQFRWLGHSVHPLQQGEMPGKGSNLNFAVRELAQEWTLANPADTMLTVLDADCLIPAAYVQYVDWLWHTDASLVKYNLFSPLSPLSANVSDLSSLVQTWEAVYQVGITGLLTMSQGVRWPFAVYSLTLRISMDVGYWDPSLVGVAEDMMNALRVWLHYTERGVEPRLIVVKVPYWCQAEGTAAARWQQQVRHCLALQTMGYTLCHTAGLPLPQRLYLAGLVNLNMLCAFSLPPVVLVCNALQFSSSRLVFWWAEACLLTSLPGALMYGVLIYHGLQLTALSQGKPAPALLTSCKAVLCSLVCTPLVVGMQQLCAMQARFWLLFQEVGLTEITYQGARQKAE